MKISIKGKVYNIELMSTPEEISRGMMGRSNIEGGMGFKLERGYHSFWMKGCLISLDIIFTLNGRVTTIHRNCEPCDDCNETYMGFGDCVFEFKAGTLPDLQIKEKIIFIDN